MLTETVVISSRFCGPPQSGNGGYVCGRLAKYLSGSVSVRLKAPPPLEVGLRVESAEGEARLYHDSTLIAEAKNAQIEAVAPPAPSFIEAVEASKAHLGFGYNLFLCCFVCGAERTSGDGMRIFPGQVEGRSLVAAPQIPDPSLANGSNAVLSEFIWAALDCSGGFSLPVPAEETAIVLGELRCRIDGEVNPHERCVVTGWTLSIDGRKRVVGSAVFSELGSLVAIAQGTWIEVSCSVFTSNQLVDFASLQRVSELWSPIHVQHL